MRVFLRQRCLVGLSAALLCAGAVGCRTNPVTGYPELILVSERREIALGDGMHPNVVFMYDGEYQDPDLNRYLGTIAMRLHNCSHRRQVPMEFTMVNTSVVNAFATPAHVYATRGFLARLGSEAEFAAAMGHELAHVAAGHTAKQLTRNVLTGLAFGVANYATGDSLAGQLAVGASQVSVALLGLSYSRGQERQADRVGAYYMALAGYNPQQAISMQRLLASLSQRKDSVLDRYLSTHPRAEDRIAEINAVIKERDLDSEKYRQGDGVYADRWHRRLAHLAKVDKAFAPYDRGMKLISERRYEEALSAAGEAISMDADQAPFYRLKGDALRGLRRLGEAATSYGEALMRDKRYVPANVGLGLVFLGQEKFAEAEGQFVVATHGFPGGAAGWYGLGAARYKLRRYPEAIKPLELAVQALPREPMVHYMLGFCYDQAGRYREAYAAYRQALALGLSGPERDHALGRAAALGVLTAIVG